MPNSTGARPPFSQQSKVDIKRDNFGVPHVYGEDVPHVFYGYGYIAATDRLFQLEMRRRQARGQLAEVLGRNYTSLAKNSRPVSVIDFDIKMRADFDAEDLMFQFNGLPDYQKSLLEAYLAGLNLRIRELRNTKDKLPPQFIEVWGAATVDTALHEWTLVDLLAATTNALTSYVRNTTALDNEKLFGLLEKKFGAKAQQYFDAMVWVNDPHAPTTKGDFVSLPVNKRMTLDLNSGVGAKSPFRTTSSGGAQASTAHAPTGGTAASSAAHPDGHGAGQSPTTSMAILVRPKNSAHTAIQLNGPQPGWFQPSYFYTIGLHAKHDFDSSADKPKPYDVVGHAPSALIAITTGQNSRIAWGSTSAGGDHTIIFKEAHGVKLETLSKELIVVKGEAKPVELSIQRVPTEDSSPTTRKNYRTVLQGQSENATPLLSKQVLWKGHELTSVMAWERAAHVGNWGDFMAQGVHMAMGYNWFYSDVDGNIGWLFGGFFPAPEANGWDPRFPRDAAKFKGPVPYKSYANDYNLFNPDCGFIVNWNNKPAHTYNNRDLQIPRWSQGDRTNILIDLINRVAATKKGELTPDDVRRIYETATIQDVNFYHFAPFFDMIDSANTHYPKDVTVAAALQILQKWDGQRLADLRNPNVFAGAAPAIFRTWLTKLVETAFVPVFDPTEPLKGPYTGTLQLPTMRNSLNLAMGTKVVLHALQLAAGLRPDEKAPAPLLFFENKEAVFKAVINALAAAVAELSKGGIKEPHDWRLPIVKQEFFPENYEGFPNGLPTAQPCAAGAAANRGAMQRLAIATGGGMTVTDSNPPGASEDTNKPLSKNQLGTYEMWEFKPLPFKLPDNVGVVTSLQNGSVVKSSEPPPRAKL